jgi:hypothetical protein
MVAVLDSVYKGIRGVLDFTFNKSGYSAIKEVTPLNPEQIERDAMIRRMAEALKTAQAQLAEYQAKERDEVEDEKDEAVQQEMIKKLNEKQKEIHEEEIGMAFSFKEFMTAVDKGLKIEVTDKDDKAIFGMFGNFVSLESGELALVDTNGKLIVKGPNLSSIIYKPEGLHNYLKRGRLPIPYDENKQYVPDLEKILMPEMIYNPETDDYTESRELIRPIKDMILERERELSESRQYTERLEHQLNGLRQELNEVKRANSIYKVKAENADSELSKVMGKEIERDMHMGDVYRRVVSSTELLAVKEKVISQLENINRELMAKAENLGVKSDFEKLQANIMDNIEWAKGIVPEKVTYIGSQEPSEKTETKPQAQSQVVQGGVTSG